MILRWGDMTTYHTSHPYPLHGGRVVVTMSAFASIKSVIFTDSIYASILCNHLAVSFALGLSFCQQLSTSTVQTVRIARFSGYRRA